MSHTNSLSTVARLLRTLALFTASYWGLTIVAAEVAGYALGSPINPIVTVIGVILLISGYDAPPYKRIRKLFRIFK